MNYTEAIVAKMTAGHGWGDLSWEGTGETVDRVRLYAPRMPCSRSVLYVAEEEIKSYADRPPKALYVRAESKEQVFCELLDAFFDLEDWYERMLSVGSGTDSVQKILQIGTEKFLNPIAHFDRSGTLSCWAGDFQGDYSGTIWKPVLDYGYTPYEFYSLPEWRKISHEIEAVRRPEKMYVEKDPKHAIAGAGIFADGNLIGTIGVTEINTKFTEEQMDLLMVIRKVLEKAYQHSGQLREQSENSYTILKDLIDSYDEGKARIFLKRAGFAQGLLFRILVITCAPGQDATMYYFSQRIQKLFPRGKFCRYEESGVLLFPSDCLEDSGRDTLLKRIQNGAVKEKIRCVISSPFSSLANLKSLYQVCREAAETLSEAGVTFLEDVWLEVLRKRLDKWGKQAGTIHPLLKELYEQNEDKRPWIRELYCYLMNGKNLTAAAGACYLHRNTMQYHIEKLGELLHLDLPNLSEGMWLYLLLSCLLLIDS